MSDVALIIVGDEDIVRQEITLRVLKAYRRAPGCIATVTMADPSHLYCYQKNV